MPARRFVLILASALMLSGVFGDVVGAQAPKIGKPRPAPATPPNVPPLPPAVIDNSLSVGGQDVKARKIETRLSVEVMLNGNGPYRFIVDSGADTSAVGVRIAQNLRLPLSTPAILNGMTARSLVDRVKVDALTVGPTTVRNLEMPALNEYDLGGDGMIGIDALVEQRLLMDFEKKLIKVEDARRPEKFSADDIVIIARRQRGQLILTHVRAAGLPLDAVIDTGTEISIGNIPLRDKLIRNNRDKFVTIPVTGVTGVTVELQLAVIGQLELGSVELQNVPIAFADVPPFKLFGLSNEPALLLGTDILETFRRVSLDFRARKVRFQLRKCDAGITINTSPDTMTRLSSRGGAEVCGR
ncbi:MAG: retroviral-like aspartic protease family protein [Sphingomicrobium sp.]